MGVRGPIFQMLIYLCHVESLNWGNVFKNRWDLCSHNPGDPFRVGEGGGGFFHCLEKSFKVRGGRTFGKLETQRLRGCTRGDNAFLSLISNRSDCCLTQQVANVRHLESSFISLCPLSSCIIIKSFLTPNCFFNTITYLHPIVILLI